MTSHAQLAYEAYSNFTHGKTFDGRDMSAWGDLPAAIQEAWNWAATAVRHDQLRELGLHVRND